VLITAILLWFVCSLLSALLLGRLMAGGDPRQERSSNTGEAANRKS
jgi:glycerol-3-phosphate acyltransferase PlsY